MRRQDREISDLNEQLDILKRCDVVRLALNDEDGYPYIIPLNYGIGEEKGKPVLYFHSALEGKKLELIRDDNRACFEVDGKHELQYFEDKGYCTYAYESVIGKGKIYFEDKEENKFAALNKLMSHYHEEKVSFNTTAVPRTCVYKLVIDQMQGKRKEPKND